MKIDTNKVVAVMDGVRGVKDKADKSGILQAIKMIGMVLLAFLSFYLFIKIGMFVTGLFKWDDEYRIGIGAILGIVMWGAGLLGLGDKRGWWEGIR